MMNPCGQFTVHILVPHPYSTLTKRKIVKINNCSDKAVANSLLIVAARSGMTFNETGDVMREEQLRYTDGCSVSDSFLKAGTPHFIQLPYSG
jgi:hypothetical protein